MRLETGQGHGIIANGDEVGIEQRLQQVFRFTFYIREPGDPTVPGQDRIKVVTNTQTTPDSRFECGLMPGQSNAQTAGGENEK